MTVKLNYRRYIHELWRLWPDQCGCAIRYKPSLFVCHYTALNPNIRTDKPEQNFYMISKVVCLWKLLGYYARLDREKCWLFFSRQSVLEVGKGIILPSHLHIRPTKMEYTSLNLTFYIWSYYAVPIFIKTFVPVSFKAPAASNVNKPWTTWPGK